MHGDADGARLIGDGTGDRLADPPGGIGTELVATAIFELIHRLHQADIAFLDQIQELQAAIGVFFGDGDNKAQIGLDHFLLRLGHVAFAARHGRINPLEFRHRQAGFIGSFADARADLFNLSAVFRDKGLPALARQITNAFQPGRVHFAAAPLRQEFIALDLLAIGQAQHLAFHRGHAAVQRFQLINQFFDAVIVQLHLFNQRDQFLAELFVILLAAQRQFLARGKGFHALGTQL